MDSEKPLKGFNFLRRSNTPINEGVNETWSEQVPEWFHPLLIMPVETLSHSADGKANVYRAVEHERIRRAPNRRVG